MTTAKQKRQAIHHLRRAFDGVIDFADELNIDAEAFEEAKQLIVGRIIDACPDADPGTFVELADGRRTLLSTIRKHPSAFIMQPNGEWALREAANVVKLRPKSRSRTRFNAPPHRSA
jgi:hypothetical protein